MDNNDTVKTTVGIADDANADTVSINDNGEVQPKEPTASIPPESRVAETPFGRIEITEQHETIGIPAVEPEVIAIKKEADHIKANVPEGTVIETTAEPVNNVREYVTEEEARSFRSLFKRNLKSYKSKPKDMTNKQWLEEMFKRELPELSAQQAAADANEIVDAIKVYDESYASVNEAAKNGISKEQWLADRIQESSVGMSVNEYGRHLQTVDDILYQKNMEIDEALRRHADGNVMMSPNLDGNIAEHMLAKTTEANAQLQGKNIRVDVLGSHNANSVDIRILNMDTGKYQNYQAKFGKDAKATIELIERGNYNNQRIIVPSDQLKEVQAYFKAKGSNKTITDRIEMDGVKGKPFTKDDVKKLQHQAQQDGLMPSMDYSHYNTKDLAMSIGKNAGVMALQSMAIVTGYNVVSKLFKGESVDKDEIVEVAIKTGVDTGIKTVTAGTLQVAIRKGILKFIPKATSAGIIANIACVGIENVKIFSKVISGELSLSKGMDQMGRATVSMAGGLYGAAKGAAIGVSATAWIPVVGPVLGVATGLVGGMIGYFAGSKVGDAVYSCAKKVASAAKTVAKAAVNGLKKVGSAVVNGVKSVFRGIASLFGF